MTLRFLRNTMLIVVLLFILAVATLYGSFNYLSFLRPLPVISNWNIKGSTTGLRMNPTHSIDRDGAVGHGAIELRQATQIVITRAHVIQPQLIDDIESIAIKLNGKIYVISPAEGAIHGFRD